MAPKKKLRYEVEVGADTKGADEVQKALEKTQATAAKETSINVDGTKASAEAQGVHNAVQSANKAADDHASINIDGSKATAEAKETEKAIKKTKDVAEKPSGKKSFFARLKGDIKELRDQFPLINKGFELMELAAKGPIAAVILAVGTLVLGFKGLVASVRAYVDEARAISKIDAALAQNGLLTKENRKQVLALATEYGDLTAVLKQDWLTILTKLTVFGSKPETLGIDAKAVENLAGLLGGRDGLSQATDLYARALQGEFGSFQELGFELDLSASKHENLAKVQERAARGSGILRAEARSEGGQLDTLGLTVRKTAEGFGRLLANTGLLSGGIAILKSGFSSINSILPQTTEQLDGLINKLPLLSDELRKSAKSAEKLGNESLNNLAKDASAAEQALAGVLTRIRELEAAEIAKIDAGLANDLAQVDLDVANNSLTPEQANEKRFEIRQKASKRKLDIETKSLEEQIEKLRVSQDANNQKLLDKMEEGNLRGKEIAEQTAVFQTSIDADDRLGSQLKKLDTEKTQLEEKLAKLEQVESEQGILRALPPGLRGPGQQKEIEDNQSSLFAARSRLAEIAEERKPLQAARDSISSETSAAVNSIQQLHAEVDGIRKDFVELRENRDAKNPKLESQIESLETRLGTKRETGAVGLKTSGISRQASRVTETRALDEKAEEKRKEAAGKRTDQATRNLGGNLESALSDFESAPRRAGESSREAGLRSSRQGELARLAREKAAGLSDGADEAEFKELESAMLDLFNSIDAKASEGAKLKSEVQRMGQAIRTLKEQVKNLRN